MDMCRIISKGGKRASTCIDFDTQYPEYGLCKNQRSVGSNSLTTSAFGNQILSDFNVVAESCTGFEPFGVSLLRNVRV